MTALPAIGDQHATRITIAQATLAVHTIDSESGCCPACGEPTLRPDVVWFGEVPYEMDRIQRALLSTDVFVSIGTSGAVYPAAGFVQMARACGAQTLELNLVPSEGSAFFAEARHGRASDLVPLWVDEMLARLAL